VRSLLVAPSSFVDPKTGAPAFGSYAGPLPRVDLGAVGIRDRITKRKRWLYLALTSDEVWISLAIVRTGYATTAFGFAFDRREKKMIVDRTIIAPHASAKIADDLHASGDVGRFSFGRANVSVVRRTTKLEVLARFRGLEVEATIDEADAPPSITAIERLGDGLLDATEKRALARVTGSAKCEGRSFSLDGAVGGYDYTHGLLPRHTRWRWAFGMGRANGGTAIAFNVVEGFVGEAECAAFYAGAVHPLREPKFSFDVDRPLDAWRLEADGIDLTFEPGAVHAQNTQLVVVRSRFVQPVGVFRGKVRIGDRDVVLDEVPGVVEDQDVLW
jgi:hypothetical protein